jgi:hypothetical protein
VSPTVSPSPSLSLCLPLCLSRLAHCVSHCASPRSVRALASAHGPRMQLAFVSDAGHHLYLDNAAECNALVAAAVARAEAIPHTG